MCLFFLVLIHAVLGAPAAKKKPKVVKNKTTGFGFFPFFGGGFPYGYGYGGYGGYGYGGYGYGRRFRGYGYY